MIIREPEETTAPPEPALMAGAEFGIEADPAVYPWVLLEGIERAGKTRLQNLMFKLLRDADTSDREWRGIACRECAMVIWDEMRRRGCRGLDGSKGGADYRAVSDAY